MPTLQISAASVTRFRILYGRVKDNLVQASRDLQEIKEGELWRAEFGSWKEFCELGLQKSCGWAYNQIEGGKIAAEHPEVKNESTAREARRMPAPQRRQVIGSVPNGQKVNAPALRQSRPKQAAVEDGTGLEVPPECLELWNRSIEVQQKLTTISRLKGELKKAQDEKDPLYAELDFNDAIAKLSMLFENIKSAKPYAVCPDCNGVDKDVNCLCKGRGFVSEFYWSNCVPEEKRNLRENQH